MDGDFKVAQFLRLSDQKGKYVKRYFKIDELLTVIIFYNIVNEIEHKGYDKK